MSAEWPAGRPRFRPAPPLEQPSGSPVELAADRADALRADLAGRGVDVAAFRVVSAEAVTWRDGSWGCPQPGRSYTQALEDGLRVLVEADGRTWDYRFGARGAFRLCTRPRGVGPPNAHA